MRFRRKFFGILTCILGLSTVLPLFLPFFHSVESNGTNTNNGYGMFDKFEGMGTRFKALNGQFQPAFANIISVVCIMSIVLYVIFLICFLFEALKFGAIPYRPILKAVSLVLLLLGVFALVSGIIFITMNKIVFEGRVLLSFEFASGLYILSIGSIITGLCGVISHIRYEYY